MKTNIIKFQKFFLKYEKCKIQVTMVEKKYQEQIYFW